jgi:hypothetical protein
LKLKDAVVLNNVVVSEEDMNRGHPDAVSPIHQTLRNIFLSDNQLQGDQKSVLGKTLMVLNNNK